MSAPRDSLAPRNLRCCGQQASAAPLYLAPAEYRCDRCAKVWDFFGFEVAPRSRDPWWRVMWRAAA